MNRIDKIFDSFRLEMKRIIDVQVQELNARLQAKMEDELMEIKKEVEKEL